MKKFLLAALLVGAGLFLTAPPAAAQSSAPPASAISSLPDLPQETLQQWNGKLNNYVALYNRSSRAVDSWERYKSWVNIKTGPTGKERHIYGLYETYDDVVKDLAPKAAASARAEPKIDGLDDAVLAYVDALNKLEPVLLQAAKYYDRRDYSDDNFAKGKELHPKLAEAFETAMTTRNNLDRELNRVKERVDQQELTQIEKTEGKKFNWHFRRIFMASQKIIEAAKAVHSKADAPAFSEAVKAYGQIVSDFDDYMTAATDIPPERLIVKFWPDQILSSIRGARDSLQKNSLAGFSGGVQGAITVYNQMVTFSNF